MNIWGPDDIEQVAAALRAGGVVVVPTDTVYGVAACVARPEAVAQLFSVKRRPTSVALPVMVADVADVASLPVTVSARARHVMEAFWPGPLTIVLPADPTLARRLGGEATLGLRIPNDDALRALVRRTGPLAVTSANEHGEPPCLEPDDVRRVFASHTDVAGLWDGGRRDGAVSTVVKLGDEGDTVLRHGAIDPADVAAVR